MQYDTVRAKPFSLAAKVQLNVYPKAEPEDPTPPESKVEVSAPPDSKTTAKSPSKNQKKK